MTSTRALRLGSLSTAAAVLVGLALTAAAPAQADASMQVVHDQVVSVGGLDHLVGEVVNNGSSAASAHIDATLTNGGVIVDIPFADAMVDSIGAHESAPFDIQLDPAIPFDAYSLSVVATPSAEEPNHNFSTTFNPTLTVPGSTTKQISGSIRNDNTTAADDVTIVFTFLDAAGKVVGGEAMGTLGATAIEPGKSDTFFESTDPALPAWSTFSYVVQSTTPAAKDPDASPTPKPTSPPETSVNCNPTMRLSTKTVNVGRTTTVSISNGTPGSRVTLEGYSRPSTTYAAIRSGVVVAANGTAQSFEVRPPTSARVRLAVLGCTTKGSEQVISVIPGLGITVTRVGVRTYTLSGKIIPGKQNLGRAIALYVGSGSATPTKRYTAKSASDGSYKATLTLPRGAAKAYWATGANMTNLAGKSAVKAFTVS